VTHYELERKMASKRTGKVYSLPAANKKTELELRREAAAQAEQASQEPSPEELAAELKARQDAISQEEGERRFGDQFDLVKMIAADPAVFPMEIALWGILIEVLQPPLKMGLFHKTDEQVKAEQWFAVIGKVLMCGPSALEGKTSSGIDLSRFTSTVNSTNSLIGKYVVHQRHVGQDVWFAPLPGKRLKIISATEVLAVTTNPSMFMKP
jgi:hypothetical protein